MERREYRVGDEVAWESQAGGCPKAKRGLVVCVVRAGDRPRELVPDRLGQPRLHESYVVDVAGKAYWPRVSALRLVTAVEART